MFSADCVRIRERRAAEGTHPGTPLSMRVRMKAQQQQWPWWCLLFVCLLAVFLVWFLDVSPHTHILNHVTLFVKTASNESQCATAAQPSAGAPGSPEPGQGGGFLRLAPALGPWLRALIHQRETIFQPVRHRGGEDQPCRPRGCQLKFPGGGAERVEPCFSLLCLPLRDLANTCGLRSPPPACRRVESR